MATMIFTGRMKNAPEEKDLPSGGKVLNFDVAEDTGKDETTWHNNIALYNGTPLYEFVKKYWTVNGKPISCTCNYSKKRVEKDGETRYYDRYTLLSASFVPSGKKADDASPDGKNSGEAWG